MLIPTTKCNLKSHLAYSEENEMKDERLKNCRFNAPLDHGRLNRS